MDLRPLLDRAFLVAEAREANAALARAREEFARTPDAKSFSYEAVVPEDPDPAWLTDGLIRKVVYHCESTRSPLPECAGVFVSLFVGQRLFCISAADVVGFACEVLELTPEILVERFGTGESRQPLRPTAGLLPGGDA